jgi:hypothetical protein
MTYNDEILNFCKKLGLDLVGFSECRKFSELTTFFEHQKKIA